jgi:two-component sensor histidine kinase
MRHRVKNLFALAAAVVSISARSSGSGRVIDDIRARLSSLARAHDMTMAGRPYDAGNRQASSLLTLIHGILDPYATADGPVAIGGHDCDVGAKAVAYLSLLLHELATNAAKFGSLSVASGRLDVSVTTDGDLVRLVWRETGGPAPSTGGPQGFGSRLERSVTCALNTTIERDWPLTGLVATITIPKAVLSA